MSTNDERDFAERLGGALGASMLPPAPVEAVLKKGRAIRARRRIAAAVAAAAAVSAIGVGVPIVLRAGPATVPRPGPASAPSPGRGLPPLRDNSGLFSWVSVNQLNALAAVSAQDIWTVGSASTGRPLIEHWSGRSWKTVPAPSPPGARESLLNSVTVATSSSAWAVGYYNNGHAVKTLIERWNGDAWTVVPSPSPGGAHGSFLYGVAATGPDSAWAVGYYLLGGSAVRTLIERWDGRAWKQVPSPSPGGAHAWSELHAVAAGKSGAWAVGYYGQPIRPLIERWNGRAWTFLPSPNPGGRDGGELDAVTTTGGSGVWAAGSVGTRTVDQPLIERWNGRSWNPVPSPRPAGSHGATLTAIAADPVGGAWVVGHYFAAAHTDPAVFTLIERWDGRSWRQVPSPNPGGSAISGPHQSLLQAVFATSPADVWSAGSYSSGNPHGKILIERWNGRTWAQLPAAP